MNLLDFFRKKLTKSTYKYTLTETECKNGEVFIKRTIKTGKEAEKEIEKYKEEMKDMLKDFKL
jgi:hypothetical protein